jgi:hypothetical protein
MVYVLVSGGDLNIHMYFLSIYEFCKADARKRKHD